MFNKIASEHAKHPILRVFMYHSIGPRASDDEYGLSVGKALFESQMRHLIEHKIPIVKIDDSSFDCLKIETASAAITFDDGYKDNLDAADVLVNNLIPFSIYCIADRIGTSGFLSAKDLRDLTSTGLCVIGAHGLTHRRLGTLDESEQSTELHVSKDILEQILGSRIATMSLPHGSLDSKTISIARAAGYKLVCSSRPGLNHIQKFDPMHIRRTELRSHDTLDSFVAKNHGADDWRSWVYLTKSLMSGVIPDAQWKRYR